MKVWTYMINHWEGIVSIISILISIIIYRKQVKQSKKIRLIETELELQKTKLNKKRTLSNRENHKGMPFNVQEVGHHLEKRSEYDSDISYDDDYIKFLEAQKRKIMK